MICEATQTPASRLLKGPLGASALTRSPPAAEERLGNAASPVSVGPTGPGAARSLLQGGRAGLRLPAACGAGGRGRAGGLLGTQGAGEDGEAHRPPGSDVPRSTSQPARVRGTGLQPSFAPLGDSLGLFHCAQTWKVFPLLLSTRKSDSWDSGTDRQNHRQHPSKAKGPHPELRSHTCTAPETPVHPVSAGQARAASLAKTAPLRLQGPVEMPGRIGSRLVLTEPHEACAHAQVLPGGERPSPVCQRRPGAPREQASSFLYGLVHTCPGMTRAT